MTNHNENKLECFKNIKYFYNHIGYINAATMCLNTCFEDNEELLYNLY